MTDKPTTKPPAPAAHGWRITWPMILADLVAAAALVPDVLPVLPANTPAWVRPALTAFALVVARLNHSPMPTGGGGLPRPPTSEQAGTGGAS